MSVAPTKMRKEVDFSKGVRGKFYGKTRVTGPVPKANASDLAGKIQKAIEADLKKREPFKELWKMLDKSEHEALRRDWCETIDKVLI